MQWLLTFLILSFCIVGQSQIINFPVLTDTQDNINVNLEVCDLCQNVINWTDTALQYNYTMDEFEQIISNLICPFFPKSDRQICNIFVSDFIMRIVEYSIEEKDPKYVCSKLNLCPHSVK